MSHHCKIAVITCEDYRLHQRKDGRNYIAEFIKKLGEDADLITRAGAAQDIVRPKPGFDESLFRDSEVSAKLHEAEFIYLVNHEDCGAYKDFKFGSKTEELERHKADLREAKRILEEKFRGVNVKICFAFLKPGSDDDFEIRELD
jgi:carbonic anhydrase